MTTTERDHPTKARSARRPDAALVSHGASGDNGDRGTAVLLVLSIAVIGLLVVSSILALGIGSVRISPPVVAEVVARRMHLINGEGVTALDDQIVWQLRLPRVLAAIAVGAVLALVGAVMQCLLRNELADPFLLGISSGASLGAVVAIVTGASLFGAVSGVAPLALIGAVGALGMVLAMATNRSGALPPARTVLAGVAVAQIASALTSLLIMVFGARDTAREVLSWTLGSYAGVRTDDAFLLAILAALVAVPLLAVGRTLDAFAFGDTAARSVGVDVTRVKWTLLIGCALATAGTVAFVGPIGFVGLVVPHIVRLVIGPLHRRLLPLCALVGACLMLWADTAARSVAPGQEIPVGVVTAVLGAPVLVVLLRRQARRA